MSLVRYGRMFGLEIENEEERRLITCVVATVAGTAITAFFVGFLVGRFM